MDDPRQQDRTHTWDIIIEYHRCPACGYILENREKYSYRLTRFEKDLLCERCGHSFTIIKNRRAAFGPLIGHDGVP